MTTRRTDLTEQEWLDLHRDANIVSASQVATIMGHNPWESAYTLWHKKKGLVPWQDEAIHMRAGKALEPLVDKLYQETTGRETVDFGDFTVDYHPNIPLIATLDRYDNEGRTVELKTANQFARDDWAKGDGPLHYQLQAQSQIMCAETEHGALACLVGNREFFHHDFDRHDRVIRVIEVRVMEFVESLEKGTPPPPDTSSSSMTTAAILHLKDDGSTVERPDLKGVIEQWLEAKKNASAAEKEKKELDNQLKLAFGSATYLVSDGYCLSYSHQHRKSYTVEETDYRVLRMK